MSDLSIYVDPDGNAQEREFVETLPDQATRAGGDEMVRYLKERLPPADVVNAFWGGRMTGTKDFRPERMTEVENTPPPDATPTAVKPLW